jgi:HipA-like protein
MDKTLGVYLSRELVGQLTRDDDGQMVFDYAASWLERPDATPLSRSLLLRTCSLSGTKGLLPRAQGAILTLNAFTRKTSVRRSELHLK